MLQRDLACVEFSLYSIPFLFNRQSPILSCNLTITNNTGTKLYLKIRCNNSQRYEVRPHQEILDNGAKWYIEIHLKNPSIRNSVRRVGDP